MSMEHYHPAAIIDGPGACVTIYKRSYSPEKIDKQKVEELIHKLCELTGCDHEDYTLTLLPKL